MEVGKAALRAAGRGGRVRGRAMARPEVEDSCAVRVRIAVLARLLSGTRIMRKAFSNAY